MAQKKSSSVTPAAEEYRLLDTSEITVLGELNSRLGLPEAGDLEADILTRGQIHPVICRAFGGEIILSAGYRRVKAIKKINEVPGLLDTPMKVKALIREMDEKESFLVSVSENRNRDNVSILDAAWQVKQLLEKYGMSQKKVAEHYGKDQSWVSRVCKLLGLPPDVKEQIASGNLSYTDALELLGMDKKEQQETAQKMTAPAGAGKPTRQEVRSSTRRGKKKAAARRKASPELEPPAVSAGRSLKQNRELFERWGTPDKKKGEKRKPIHAICSAIASFLDGKIQEKSLRKVLTGYLK